MSNEFIPLAQVADIIGGYAFKSDDFGSTGFPVVKIANIEPPRVNLADGERILAGKVIGLDKFRLNDRDIVMAMTGATIGKVGRVRSSEPSYLNQRVAKLSAKAGRKFDDFIFALVTQAGFDTEVINNSNGSAQANISTDGIGRILVPDFSPDEQLQIGRVVGSLDDKIELNRRMNETLEALAQSLFKSWFVDATQSALPKGWHEVPLPEAIEVNPPRPLRKGSVVPYLDMANMPTRSARALEVVEREFGSGMRFKNGDTLVARITPCLENGKTSFVDFLNDGQIAWGSTEYIVLQPKPPLPPEFAYFLARTDEFRAFMISNMTGTTGRQRVPAECLSNFKIAVPPAELAEKFGKFACSVFAKMKAHDEESRTLAALRDALRPKLLSGELRVPAAKLEEVA
jgi:type I restriction enzyme S subunit